MKTRVSTVMVVGFLIASATVPPVTSALHTSYFHLRRDSPASDMLFLSDAQQSRAWTDLHRQAVNEDLPPGFSASVGWALPSTVNIKPVPNQVSRKIPALKPYDFAMVENKLVIVNPSDEIIVQVIWDQQNGAG
jgi:Protein of unknown function (DUF1236)